MVAFDEMRPEGTGLRNPYQDYDGWLTEQDTVRLGQKMKDAENVFRRTGITFAVYGEQNAAERLIPFDIVPRIIAGAEWRRLTLGIEQRVQARQPYDLRVGSSRSRAERSRPSGSEWWGNVQPRGLQRPSSVEDP